MSRFLLIFISIALALILGFVSAAWWFSDKSTHTEIRSQGVLEQVEKVFELVTINGHFSEIYDYKEYYYYDWSITRKKALVKVKAKVSMGFDFSRSMVTLDEGDKKVIIGPVPGPSIISMDIQEEFYDIQQGTFNTFQPEDYNKIRKDIREMIRSKAMKSHLPKEADMQLTTLLDGLGELIANYGWSLELKRSEVDTPQQPVLKG